MASFSGFDEWKFSFGESTGKLGDNNTVFMKDIISESDVFIKPGIRKPIITRSGISKIMRYFKIYEKDFEPSQLEFEEKVNDKHGEKIIRPLTILIVKIILGLRDDPSITFVGNGEASLANLEDIGASYPLAVALKRARSRGVLDYLGIDAYSEEESPEFVRLDNTTEEQVKKLSEALTKKLLKDSIVALKTKLGESLDNETMKNYIQFILDKEDITLANLTHEDLILVIVGFNILKYTDAETFFTIMKAIKNDKPTEEGPANS